MPQPWEVPFEDWLKKFSALHERARAGKLSATENRTYLAARNELARAILKKTQQPVPAGAKARHLLRTATAVPVDIFLPGGTTAVHAITQELWTGGFSAIVPPLQLSTQRLKFALSLTKDSAPIEGWARVVADSAVGGSTRLGLEFESLPPAEIERIEFAVFEAVLARLLAPPGTP
jgi:hypothetical protein